MKKKVLASLVQLFMQGASRIAYTAPNVMQEVLLALLKLVRYRRGVILKNLELTGLSEKTSPEEVHRFLARVFVETLWLGKASREEINEKVIVEQPDLLTNAFVLGGTNAILTGHFGNWEMLLQKSAVYHKHRIVASYLPLSNDGAEVWMRNMRTRFEAELVIGHKILRYALKQPEGYTLSLVADQTPYRGEGIEIPFFGVPTRFFESGGQLASRFKMRILFARMVYDDKEAKYRLTFINCPFSTPTEITKWYVAQLEATILERPGDYLWTHKRFKHDGVYV